jgi:hypothetical protein
VASASRRKLLARTAAVLAAVGFFLLFFVFVTLPPRPRVLASAASADLVRRTVAGAFHVHSTISDGAGDAPTIASAAARAGLQFVILTDHGDGTRAPAPPRYVGGVLVLEGVEISTAAGHYVALDLPATPYPLGGAPEAVAEDVHRFGGFGVAAHPDSPKPELAWTTDGTVPVDGFEWLNVDSEWRRFSRARLGLALAGYAIRPGPAMTSLLHRPEMALTRWDALTARRPVVALAGHDAHGGIGRTAEDGSRSAIGGVPSYEATFRAFSTHAILEAPWSGDAGADARSLLHVVRSGRVYTVIDGVASPAVIDFRARGIAEGFMGDVLPPGPARLSVTGVPDGGDVAFFTSGEAAAGGRPAHGTRLSSGAVELSVPGSAGSWRFEVQLPGAPGQPPVPWIVGNPIYFLGPRSVTPDLPLERVVELPAGAQWHPERDQESVASAAADGSLARLEYRLAPGERRSQFAALAVDLQEPGSTFDRLAFTVRAAAPMRLSVQLRTPGGGGERWGRSVFVDSSVRHVLVPVARMSALDHQVGPLTDPARARTLLFVVDLTNARPGDSGRFEISDVRFGR